MNYVYIITCLVNQKQYVGQTKNPEARRRGHFFLYPNKEKRKQVIHEAIRKHGAENFIFEVVSEHSTEEEAFAEEHRLISQKRAEGVELYNMNDGGIGGVNPSKETRKKMSESRIDMLQKRKNKTGSKFSDETRKKISEAAKKQFQDPNAKIILSNMMKCRWEHLSDDQKVQQIERLTVSNLNREYKSLSDEIKQKIANTLRRRADEKGRAKDNIIEMIHNCPDCGQEVKRKGIAGWKSQIKSGRCRSCNVKEGHRTRKLKKEVATTAFPYDSLEPMQ